MLLFFCSTTTYIFVPIALLQQRVFLFWRFLQMKKIIKIAFVFLVVILLSAVCSALPYGELTYRVSDGEVTITGCDENVSSVIIPETIDGYPVTSIGTYAFRDCHKLKKVIIPDGVTIIGFYAFSSCTELESIEIPNSVISIDARAFGGCSSLTSVDMGDGVTSIGGSAFADCTSLERVEISDSVTSIGTYAFEKCSNLTSIKIPFSVTSIGDYAFSKCASLESIMVESNNLNYSSDERGVLFNKDKTYIIRYPQGNATEVYEIPDSVTTIGSDAFANCTNLDRITIPNSVTRIGDYAFFGCSNLTSVEISEGVISIGDGAFCQCSKLENIIIPNSVTSIGRSAFYACRNLISITIPYSIKSFPSDVFAGCTRMSSVYYTGTLESWLKIEFEDVGSTPLNSNTNVVGKKDVLYINGSPISGEIVIPDDFTSIGSYSLCGFSDITSVKIPDNVTSIGDGAFSNCESLESVTIPNSVISIGTNAFEFCRSLESITVPNSVASIGDGAFSGCTNLVEIAVPNSITTLNALTFCVCDSLTSVVIPDSVTSIKYGVFSHCDDLKDVYYTGTKAEWGKITIANGNEDLLNATIHYGYAPKSGTCGDNLNWDFDEKAGTLTISGDGDMTDYDADNKRPWAVFSDDIKKIVFSDGITSIGNISFCQIPHLTNIVIPAGVTNIGKFSFMGCTSLSSISIPDSVTTIGLAAFFQCTNISQIYYTGTYDQWKNIKIRDQNSSLKGAVVSINNKSNTTLNNVLTDKTPVYIYGENKKLLDDAEILCDSSIYLSENGIVELPLTKYTDITISHQDYNDKTVTADQLEKSKHIYLSKIDTDKPVVNGVYANNVDIVNNEFLLDILDDEALHMKADVVWKNENSKYKQIYLRQGVTRVDFDENNYLGIVLSSKFDITEKIEIVAIEASSDDLSDQQISKTVLKFKPSGIFAELDNYAINFGNEIKVTVPDDIPVIGGSDIGMEFSDFPILFSYENGKIHGVIGFELIDSSYGRIVEDDSDGTTIIEPTQEVKGLSENIKSAIYGGDFDFDKNTKDLMNLMSCTKKSIIGFDADCKVYGFFDGYLDDNANFVFLDGGIILKPSVSASKTHYVWFKPPVYFKGTIRGELEAILNLYINEVAKNFTPRGSMEGVVEVKGSLGVGIDKILSIEGGARGSLSMLHEFDPEYMNISMTIGAYASVQAIGFELFHQDWDLLDKVIAEYPSSNDELDALLMVEDYECRLLDRSYTDYESEFLANEDSVELMSVDAQNKVEHTFKTNVYTQADPQIVDLGDGMRVVVWVDDNNERSDINRTSLYYSYFDGTEWSDPCQVYDDGTSDFYPDLKLIDDTLYLTWSNANMEFDDSDSFETVFSSLDISVAVFDGCEFTNIQCFGEDMEADLSPVIFGDEDFIQVVWITNTESDIFVSGNTNEIHVCEYTNGEWSESTVYESNLTSVESLDACMIDGEAIIAYSTNLGADHTDYSGFEIFVNDSRITENETCDSGVCFYNDKLYWYNEGNIYEYDYISDDKSMTIEKPIPTDRFEVLGDGENVAIVFAETDGFGNELAAYFYDSSSDNWSDSVILTDLDGYINGISGFYNENGEFEYVLSKRTLEDSSENKYGCTDLLLVNLTPTYNLSISDVIFNSLQLVSGNTLEIDVEVQNNGELSVDGYIIEVLNDAGEIVEVFDFDDCILPGKTHISKVFYEIETEYFTPHNIVINVDIEPFSDYDDSDNEYMIDLNYNDIAIENVGYGFIDDERINVFGNLVNRGYEDASDIVVTLYKDNINSKPVDEIEISNTLSSFDSEICSFEVDYEEGALYYICVDYFDKVIGNNSDYVYIGNKFNYTVGDINLDEAVDMNDAIFLLQYSMFPELYPIDYSGNVDFTKDGAIDMNDAILLLQYSMFPNLYPIE